MMTSTSSVAPTPTATTPTSIGDYALRVYVCAPINWIFWWKTSVPLVNTEQSEFAVSTNACASSLYTRAYSSVRTHITGSTFTYSLRVVVSIFIAFGGCNEIFFSTAINNLWSMLRADWTLCDGHKRRPHRWRWRRQQREIQFYTQCSYALCIFLYCFPIYFGSSVLCVFDGRLATPQCICIRARIDSGIRDTWYQSYVMSVDCRNGGGDGDDAIIKHSIWCAREHLYRFLFFFSSTRTLAHAQCTHTHACEQKRSSKIERIIP